MFWFPIRKLDGHPMVALSSRWKSLIKWTKWLLAGIGLLTSLITFQLVIVSFGIALALFLMGLLFEKIAFRYGTLYINPLPDFQIDQDQWNGCVFGYLTPKDRSICIPLVGWTFHDAEYARKIHKLLSIWLRGSMKDDDRNVCQSVVLEAKNYHFFCYPNPDKKLAKRFYTKVEAEMAKSKATREDLHDKIYVTLVLSKTFSLIETSFLPTFKRKYHEGQYLFRIMTMSPSGEIAQIEGVQDFVLYDLKIRDRGDLSRKDMEYSYLKVI